MYMYWYYLDVRTNICYYTESYSMSVSSFAEKVSAILGRQIDAGDTSAAQRKSGLDGFDLKHI